MNNPFLSDRNIFSKVVNPLKKKSQSEKDSKPAQISQKYSSKEPYISTTPLVRQQQAQRRPNINQQVNKMQPQPKMSFGRPQEEEKRISFNKNYYPNPRQEGEAVPSREKFREFDYGHESFKTSQNPSDNYSKNNYKSISLDQNVQFTSPSQDMKFEEYRKTNNFKDYSPINTFPEKKLNDSEFLNIDAIGDDLDKFLAGSKNQEELCQLLGIARQLQPERKGEQKRVQKQPEKNQRRQWQEKQERQDREYIPEQIRIQKRKSETLPSAFMKQKQKRESEPPQPKYEESKLEERDYIPTFNNVGLENENETVSREEDMIPRFNQVNQMQGQKLKESSKDNIQVFNYSRVNSNKGDKNVQDLITEQMNSLCINGKYRTFLSSSQKIVTVRYKLQPL